MPNHNTRAQNSRLFIQVKTRQSMPATASIHARTHTRNTWNITCIHIWLKKICLHTCYGTCHAWFLFMWIYFMIVCVWMRKIVCFCLVLCHIVGCSGRRWDIIGQKINFLVLCDIIGLGYVWERMVFMVKREENIDVKWYFFIYFICFVLF